LLGVLQNILPPFVELHLSLPSKHRLLNEILHLPLQTFVYISTQNSVPLEMILNKKKI